MMRGETQYCFTMEITGHILIIVLYSVSILGVSFIILAAATLHSNQVALAKWTSIDTYATAKWCTGRTSVSIIKLF